MPKLTAILILSAAAVVLGGAGALWLFQNRGIYGFQKTESSPVSRGLKDVRVLSYRSSDGRQVTAWFVAPRGTEPTIISFPGNYSEIGSSFERQWPLVLQGYGLAMPVYRGSGGAGGKPSEELLLADGRALYDQLDELSGLQLPAESRVIHGFSLGAGLATRLASERPARALVLEAGYDSLCRYFQRWRNLPLCALMWKERYDAVRWIGKVHMPLFMAHGARDKAILPAWGLLLFDVANQPKAWRLYPGGGHADLFKHGLATDISDFLADPKKFAAAKPNSRRAAPGTDPATSD